MDADGLATESQYDTAFEAVEQACDEIIATHPKTIEEGAAYATQMALRAPSDAAHPVAWVLTRASGAGADTSALNGNLAALADIFRDIFGNPFSPAYWNPVWSTDNVAHLAELIYNQRDFGRMRDLADALEHAGCQERAVLDHCRGKGPHVRGCWPLDLALGKPATRAKPWSAP